MVKHNLSRVQRSVIVKLKASVLPVAIETGRFRNIDEVDRECLICGDGGIEDVTNMIMRGKR